MKYKTITAVGLDVSKGESTVAVHRPGGEVVLTPFRVNHNAAGLSGLDKTLRDVGGDIRALSFGAELRDYSPEDEPRQMLKMQNRVSFFVV